MGWVRCPTCGKSISQNANPCPYCAAAAAPATADWRRPARWIVALLGLVVIVTLAMQPGQSPDATARARASSSEYLACRDFSRLADRAGKGLMTPAEIRAALQDVYDTARVEPSRVSALAEDLLRMATQGRTRTKQYGDTIGALLRECIAVADSRE